MKKNAVLGRVISYSLEDAKRICDNGQGRPMEKEAWRHEAESLLYHPLQPKPSCPVRKIRRGNRSEKRREREES